METVRILGAGPAGLTAAITLARAGFDVEVMEQRNGVGTRFSGDLQGLENWSRTTDILDELGEMGIETDFDHAPYTDLLISNAEEVLRFSCARPAFYLLRRGPYEGSLDLSLLRQATDAGANIHFSRSIPPADADIVATGPSREGIFAVAKGFTFTTDMENTAIGLIDPTSSRGGYAYLLVMDGIGCLATVLMHSYSDVAVCLRRAEHLFEQMTDLEIRDPHPCGGVGSYMTERRFMDGTCRFAGEAAGLQDPMWGFGIRFAVRSGYCAAQSIIEGFEYGDAASSTFEPLMRAGTVNRYLWDRYGVKNYNHLFGRLRGVQDPLSHLHSFHSFNIYQRMLYSRAERHLRDRYARGSTPPE
ncbi:NAD(P)/FAD-dependent oxidoreductase [Methanofollis fontis]|nr:NAD(P)/FAD-dependent oxidoreductase [Methanofollis fontis]